MAPTRLLAILTAGLLLAAEGRGADAQPAAGDLRKLLRDRDMSMRAQPRRRRSVRSARRVRMSLRR